MEQRTIHISTEHTEEEARLQAVKAIDELEKEGVTFLPAKDVDCIGEACQIFTYKGRVFRYIRQFDIGTGITLGRIDIRYVREDFELPEAAKGFASPYDYYHRND